MAEIACLIWGIESAGDVQQKCRKLQLLAEALETDQGEGCVKLRLQHAFAPTVAILANWLFIMPKAWAARLGDWDGERESAESLVQVAAKGGFRWVANGTGPYKLEQHRPGKVILARHDDYWSKRGYFRRIEIVRTDDPVQRRNLLTNESADFAVCAREGVQKLGPRDNVRVFDELPELNVNPIAAFTFNIEAKENPFIGSGRLDGKGIPSDFFADSHVRRACAFAFDYDEFLREGLAGKGQRALGPIPSRILPEAWDEDLLARSYGFSIDRAREEWRAAWGGELYERGCAFTILTHEGNPERIFAAELLAEGVRGLGPNISVSVLPVEWTEYLDLIQEHRAPIFWIGWQADYGDPHNFARGLMHSRGFFATAQRFCSAELDSLVERAVTSSDQRERTEAYRRLNATALDFSPHIYTFERERFVVLHSSIDGLNFNPFRASVFYYRDLYRTV
jgi:peptide/nickel transport system substrate-binding protein